MTKIFKRKIYNEILKWKKDGGRTALLIKGARRIGKSTIVKEFVEKEYKSYVMIDFSNVGQEINNLFLDISNKDRFFANLQLLTGVQLFNRESVIVFDEVQCNPLARQAIKHLVHDGRYDYIETGSLLSIQKNVKDILIPSEESSIVMHPLDFEEFCWAIGEDMIPATIRSILFEKNQFGESQHRYLMKIFREYMLIGGMPQAISKYLEDKNYFSVEKVKRNIIELYQNDFRKIDRSGMYSKLFSGIPGQLNANLGRYEASSVSKYARPSKMHGSIVEMADSKVIDVSYAITDPNIGLGFSLDMSRFKLFTADTGIFTTLAFINDEINNNEFYKQFIKDKVPANLGYLFENAVSQIIVSTNKEPYFYTYQDKESKHSYEIDFIFSKNGKIIPIEVKSSQKSTCHKSLDKFMQKFSNRIDIAYVIHTKDINQFEKIYYVPIYAFPFILEM